MLRDVLFRSGAPLMIALVCMVSLGYVAVVRRERLARFWAVAWGLLVLRYAWTSYWGSPYPSDWTSLASAMMRIGFAMTVLAGALALHGVRLPWRWIAGSSVVVPLALFAFNGTLPAAWRTYVVLALMFVLLMVAATRIARAEMLPPLERRITAVALAVYASLSAVSSLMPNGSVLFTTTTVVAWAAQLVVALSVLATVLRLSIDAELASRALVEKRLALALGGFVHLCMHCKAVRNEAQHWEPLERFIADRTTALPSHGLCPDCATKHYPEEFANLAGTPIRPALGT